MLLLISALLVPQAPAFVVENRALVSRSEVVRVSLPLPRGRFRQFDGVEVCGRWAPAQPLLRWPDGSLAVVQLQPRLTLEPVVRRRILVDLATVRAPNPADLAVLAESAWHLQRELPLYLELLDPWGAVYRARLVPDPSAGVAGYLQRSRQVRVRRYRSVFRRVDEAGVERRFFGLTAYLTTVRGRRGGELTLVVDNGMVDNGMVEGGMVEGGDQPVLGPARFHGLALVVEDPWLKTRPRFIRENRLRPPQRPAEAQSGAWRQVLLAPGPYWYLGDHTGKAWRFDLFADGPTVTQAERSAASLATEQPLVAFADLAWVRHTRAFGAHGGLAPGPGRPTPVAAHLLQQWHFSTDLGPFGGCGDPRDAARNGTPRNGATALHNVLRFASPGLLQWAEIMVLQQCLRPTPGQKVRVPTAAAPLRQGLGPRAMQQPHGFTALDYEHFSADLLYDYYWLTGDALARDELRRLGRGLLAVLEQPQFVTCRGEGWCLQAAVLIARATEDPALVAAVDARFRKRIVPALGTDQDGYVLRQPPHPQAFDGHTGFDSPWQMAAFVHGTAAMFTQTGAVVYRDAALRAARAMAGPGWLQGHGPKYLLATTGSGRYSMPVGFGPLEGTALMELGGFVLAEAMTDSRAEQALFHRRARELFAPYQQVSGSRNAVNPWFQLYLDAEARAR